ncbi:MAG: hypothetical protein VB066_00170 [Paludibacter sp.]|nr:hypothetical protein [Paludibacter sp.]
MNSTNKLAKLHAEDGIFKNGFTVLSVNQLDKLKGGIRPGGNLNAGNCGNCGCTNVGC